MKRNGIIPLIYKRIICTLWKGHNYFKIKNKRNTMNPRNLTR